MKKVRVGIVGCGAISPQYFNGCAIYDVLEVAACADLDFARAQARAKEFGVPRALSVEDLLRDTEIDLVINLTVPQSHASVNRAALEAGKHVYVEKPFGLDRKSAAEVLAFAKKKKLLTGCAPDTFLGGGIQTCRKLIDDGAIGTPVAASANFACRGHERWHPSPQFYYLRGGGPMFDMGPYYLTALVNLLGPAQRVSGSARTTFATRTITSQPLAGTIIPVETPTHIVGSVDFASGAVASIAMSFDIWHHNLPRLEIYGSEGSLVVPDPNTFGGDVLLRRGADENWQRIEHTHVTDIGRGTGVADMAIAIRTGRPHRASGELATHVVDIMQAFEESSEKGRHVVLKTTVDRPAALPAGMARGNLD